MSDVKLYTKLKSVSNKYYEAVAVICDVCNKIFPIKKGFQLIDGFLTCYKHLDLREYSSTVKEQTKSRVPVCESSIQTEASGVPE